MIKTFTGFIVLAMLVLMLSSCSRLLRPTAGAPRKHKGNTGDNNANTTEKNPVYNSGAFTGTLIKNIAYTTAANYKGTEQQLAFDVYKPADAEGKKFPAIILIHGGSFIGGDKANLSSTCSKLANNGYVVISINYRLGWGFVSRSTASCNDSNLLKQAIYRSAQDAHTALRYIAAHADDYNIDKNWIFLGGQSAGAIAALMTAYLLEKNADILFSGFAKKLGLLDKDKDNSGADFKFKGVISMGGAFENP